MYTVGVGRSQAIVADAVENVEKKPNMSVSSRCDKQDSSPRHTSQLWMSTGMHYGEAQHCWDRASLCSGAYVYLVVSLSAITTCQDRSSGLVTALALPLLLALH